MAKLVVQPESSRQTKPDSSLVFQEGYREMDWRQWARLAMQGCQVYFRKEWKFQYFQTPPEIAQLAFSTASIARAGRQLTKIAARRVELVTVALVSRQQNWKHRKHLETMRWFNRTSATEATTEVTDEARSSVKSSVKPSRRHLGDPSRGLSGKVSGRLSGRSPAFPRGWTSDDDFVIQADSVLLADLKADDQCARHFLWWIAKRYPAWIGLWVSSRTMEEKLYPQFAAECGITRPWCSTARQLRKFTQKRVKEFPIVASDRCYAVTQYLIQKPADRSTAEFVQLFDAG